MRSATRGLRYITVVVNHDTRRLVWASVGRDRANLHAFFDALGERCGQIAFVSSDSADWIEEVVRARIPAAVHCADPFHVVQWAQTALPLGTLALNKSITGAPTKKDNASTPFYDSTDPAPHGGIGDGVS
jgi:transposase